MDHSLRAGRFTSSKIAALMSNGKVKGTYGEPFYTYVEEKYFETKLGRRLDNETNAKPTSWGKLVESIAFEELGMEYNLVSQETIVHPENELWSGSPDLQKLDEGQTVCDEKCPMTLKSFCQLVDPLYDGLKGIDAMNAIRFGWVDKNGKARKKHKDAEDYYWQLVSNSILLGTKYAELIVFVPYQDQLDKIRESAANKDGDQNKYWSIYNSTNEELPSLIPGIHYKNINIIRFEVPQSDKDALTERVNAACKELKIMLDEASLSQKKLKV